MLHELIAEHRQEIIARTRAKGVARLHPAASSRELDEGMPNFLDQIIETLRQSTSRSGALNGNAMKHGAALLQVGFSVSQVVHGYGDVCQAVTELALENKIPISADEFRVFNGCLDEAIASAVTEYERQREESISRKATERVGVLAHELRNSLNTAFLAFATLKRGVVGPESSTGGLLNRSLLRLRELIDRSLSEVRLEAGVLNLERLSVADIVQDVAIGSVVDASNRGVRFATAAVDPQLAVDGDRQLLVGAVENLVQNALKFTRPGSQVTLEVGEASGQVLIEVADECGGLPPNKLPELFEAFQQHGADRTGLGLGLWISRTSITRMGGKLFARDLPGHGCVFTISLPRAH